MPIQRGRKSTAALTVIVPLPGQRHEPPDYLTKDQKNLWRAIAATKPSTWFDADSYPLLVAYCRHASTADLLSAQIDATPAVDLLDKDDRATYVSLLKLRAVETAALVNLARALRLSPHSRLKAETAATQSDAAGGARKPWA